LTLLASADEFGLEKGRSPANFAQLGFVLECY